jgi:hypothetical protein
MHGGEDCGAKTHSFWRRRTDNLCQVVLLQKEIMTLCTACASHLGHCGLSLMILADNFGLFRSLGLNNLMLFELQHILAIHLPCPSEHHAYGTSVRLELP